MEITQEFVADGLARAHYITNQRVETAVFLALALDKPLLIEGPAGAGKTEIAKVIAAMLAAELVRLQCYEGLDEARALYEWNYQKQLLRLQADQAQGRALGGSFRASFSRASTCSNVRCSRQSPSPRRVVLLIDEIDKADEEFEAFLLELLSDFQVSVPELGTLRAHELPVVVLTSNRARELSEALRRRCLHLFIDLPGIEQERKIIALKVPGLDERLAAEAARFVSAVRKLELAQTALDRRDAGLVPRAAAARDPGARHGCDSHRAGRAAQARGRPRQGRVESGGARAAPAVTPLRDQIVNFVAALRAAGIRISVSESIDAARAVGAAGLERASMCEALAAALVKDEGDRAVFDQTFAQFFSAPAIRQRARAAS